LIVGALVGLVGIGLSLLAVGHSASIPSRSTDACAAPELRNSWLPAVFLMMNPAAEPASACAAGVHGASFGAHRMLEKP
jgi:hypothetical protein